MKDKFHPNMRAYKYRGGSSEILERDLESIANDYFWAPKVDQLNDPSEAYVDDTQVATLLKDTKNGPLGRSYDELLSMRHSVGVYSLSKTPLDELMWAYYASSHTGFCIEYDLNRLILEARTAWNIIDVSYHPTPQTITFGDIADAEDEVEILDKMVGTKSLRWNHEEETRVVTATSGRNNYASEALTGIYFGCRCDLEYIDKFRQKLAGRNIIYYKMRFSSNSYKMISDELPYNADLDGEKIEYLASIDELAIPKLEHINEQYKRHYKHLKKASEIVRRDTSCNKVTLVDFSTVKIHRGKPVIYVQYETKTQTQFHDIVTRHFTIEKLEET
jgi:Protein of unknown function (DUF2971)